MNEQVVAFAGELLTALAKRDGLTKVMVAVNQEEEVVTAFASSNPCGRPAMYAIDFRDVFTGGNSGPLIMKMIRQVEVQLTGQSVVNHHR